jgi:hypothetical protein
MLPKTEPDHSAGSPERRIDSSGGGGLSSPVVIAILTVSLLVALAILFDWWPVLRGIGWQWGYVSPSIDRLLRVIPALLVLAAYCAGLVLLRKSADWLSLAWCVLGAVAVPVSLLYVGGDPYFILFSRTVSKYSTGAYAASLTITDIAETVAGWPDAMPTFVHSLPHMSVSSPVWPSLYYALQHFLERSPVLSAWLALPLIPLRCQNYRFLGLNDAQIASAWLGILSPASAALTAIPLFMLGRQVGDRALARQAVAWWPLIPALTMFAATLSSAYVLFAVLAIWLFWKSLRSPADPIPWQTHLLRFLAGCLLGLLISWNFSLIPLLAFMGILTLLRWQWGVRKPTLERLSWPLLVGVELVAGIGLVWGLYTLWAGHSPIDLLPEILSLHTGFGFSYWRWLLLDPWDVILFMGLPAFGLAVAGVTTRRGASFRQYAIALGLTLLVMVLSGTMRGEVGRIWMFFMPLILLLAAGALAPLEPMPKALLTGAQILWLIVVAIDLTTIVTGDVPPPPRYQEVALSSLPQPVVPAHAEFAGDVELTGYQAAYQPDTRTLTLALHWAPLRPMRRPHYFSAVLVDPTGEVLPAVKWQPFKTGYPTTCWYGGIPPGGQIVDWIDLPLGADPAPGNWWVSLSAFDLAEDQPPVELPVLLADGRADRQVGLGPLEVAATQ